ncbi:MAG TPA: hypothetical protein VMZ01_04665 [Aestuariivirga sp.]|nr:hypothetical protein [Aestuariivirga sp.]
MSKTFTAALLLLLTAPNFAQATVRNYFAPEQAGLRLDSCLTGAADCGKPAADAFCKAEGFETAIIFQREVALQTIRLGNGAFCTGPTCTSFRQIKCYTSGDALTSASN